MEPPLTPFPSEKSTGAAGAEAETVGYRAKKNSLVFDSSTETFTDREANQFLKPHYRKGFAIPDSV